MIRSSWVSFAAAVALAVSGVSGFACSTSAPSLPTCENDFQLLVDAIGCPASFDGSEAQLPTCRPSDGYTQTVWLCDVIYLHTGVGTTEGDCYYDNVSHALVGVRRYATTSAFCDGGSLTESAGRQPRSCPQTPAFDPFCPPTASP